VCNYSRWALAPFVSAAFLWATAAHDAVAGPAADRVAEGARIYGTYCIQCHSPGLVGGAGPALKGREFVAKWQGKKARQLYSRILMTMPANNPGSLSSGDVLALVGFITKQNSLAPTGKPWRSPDDLNEITLRGRR